MTDSRLLEELSGWTTWHGTTLPHTPEAQAQETGTGTPVAPAPAPKRNHNRRTGSTDKGRLPLTTEQKQHAVTLAAAGYAPSRVAKTMGKSRLMVKRHLEEPETIVKVEDERAQLVEIYRSKAVECAVGITADKIQKSSALQLATASGICLDKSLLLSGQPTSIHVHALIDVLDAIKERLDEEEERQEEEYRRQFQQAKAARALLSLPAKQP